jgi:hypothetical protein
MIVSAEVDDSIVMDDTTVNVERKIVRSMIGSALEYRPRCRNRRSRENEVRCKLSLFNLIQLAMRREFWC